MPRPRRDTADEFTSTEMAVAAGMSPRNFTLLQERGLAPEPKRHAARKSAARSWNTFGLSQIGVAGALLKGGLNLFAAARLAHFIASEQGAAYGHFITRLDRYFRDDNLRSRFPDFPWLPTDKLKGDVRDDFWLHHYLRTLTDVYTPREAYKGDFLLEIIDQQYVFYGALHDLRIQYADGSQAQTLCRITNWNRGEDVSVQLVVEEVGTPIDTTEGQRRMKEIEAEFAAARKNAISFLRVNMSLAIRTALDNVHDYRGASFDFRERAAKPRRDRR